MNKFSKTVFVAAILTTVLMWIILFVRHENRKAGLARLELEKAAPVLADRIDLDTSKLAHESTTGSLARLSHVDMFYWPGPPMPSMIIAKRWIPLGEDADQEALEAIMSNRRFRKLLVELGAMQKTAASRMVNHEL